MIAPTFHGEVQLAGWKESHTSGATVTFWLPDSVDLDVFRGLTAKKGNQAGHRFACVLVEIGDDDQPVQPVAAQPQEPAKPGNSLASHLHKIGWFRNPRLWDALDAAGIYTQAQHKERVEAMRCCWPSVGEASRCDGDVVLHHVRSAANSGTGIKPPHWYGIPLCAAHHHTIHAHATREINERAMVKAIAITAEASKAAVRDAIGISSMSEITLSALNELEEFLGLPATSYDARGL